jgi:hypothetical protein
LQLLCKLLPGDFQQQLQGVVWQYKQERTFAAASGVLHLLQDMGLDYPALLPSDVQNDNGAIGAVLLLQLLQVRGPGVGVGGERRGPGHMLV